MTTPVFKKVKKCVTENRDKNFNNQHDLRISVVIKDGNGWWKRWMVNGRGDGSHQGQQNGTKTSNRKVPRNNY